MVHRGVEHKKGAGLLHHSLRDGFALRLRLVFSSRGLVAKSSCGVVSRGLFLPARRWPGQWFQVSSLRLSGSPFLIFGIKIARAALMQAVQA